MRLSELSAERTARRTVPIESKWVDDQWRSDAKTVEAKYRSGIFATKSILNTDHSAWAFRRRSLLFFSSSAEAVSARP